MLIVGGLGKSAVPLLVYHGVWGGEEVCLDLSTVDLIFDLKC